MRSKISNCAAKYQIALHRFVEIELTKVDKSDFAHQGAELNHPTAKQQTTDRTFQLLREPVDDIKPKGR
jgi:hypothetical protein